MQADVGRDRRNFLGGWLERNERVSCDEAAAYIEIPRNSAQELDHEEYLARLFQGQFEPRVAIHESLAVQVVIEVSVRVRGLQFVACFVEVEIGAQAKATAAIVGDQATRANNRRF